MEKSTRAFDPKYYLKIAEASHECGIDQSGTTTRIYNQIATKLVKYLRRFDPLPPRIIDCLTEALTHPKRGVRVQAAADLLTRGYVEGWPIMIKEAIPAYIPGKDASSEEWRNFCANQSARRFIMCMYKSIEHLPLSPRIEEAEARWRAETDLDAPIPILKMVIRPNIPIR